MALAATETGKWIGDDPDTIQFLLTNPLPRAGSYARQLAIDVRSWRPWFLISQGTLFLLFGLATGASLPIAAGAVNFIGYAIMFWLAARGLREGFLLIGEVQIVRPRDSRVAKAEATLSGGDTIWVVLPPEPATHLIVRHGSVEVLILSSPVWGTCTGVGVRVPAHSAEPGVLHDMEK